MGKIVFVLVSLFVCQFSFTIHAQQFTYLNQTCRSNYGEYHEDNLNLVFDTLISKASSTKFYNVTFGENKYDVYGIFQCRYDVSLDVCSACVKDASLKIKEVCPLSTSAIVWYDECMLRYSNKNIFSRGSQSPEAVHSSNTTITNYAEFAPILEDAMKTIILKAAAELPHFASNTTKFTSSQYIYSFAQCTPDISVTKCKHCLEGALSTSHNRCCKASIYVTVLKPSCVLRYDTTGPFLNGHQSPDDPSSANLATSAGQRKKTSLQPATIGAIVAYGNSMDIFSNGDDNSKQ
ncbi:antimicrobial ginkbilobin-2-like protein [Silene latifolia]|uniref:antimicrobial ginkbilobin-2-like protein n=1 Tax=Silene latifolia TaxID=37657 RepID=UPI003D77EF7E